MNLLTIENGHLTALFQISRIKGQLFLPEAAAMLSSRFNFSAYPQSYNELSAERVEFKHAQFGDAAIESLEIYSDGVVISSRSDTDIIEAFFVELCDWLETELDLSLIQTHSVDKIYDSTITFQTDKNILQPLDAFTEIADLLQSDSKENSGLEVKFEPIGWTLAADSTQNPAMKPINFRIERHAGVAFSMQHYISAAPLKTKQHLILLERLQSLV